MRTQATEIPTNHRFRTPASSHRAVRARMGTRLVVIGLAVAGLSALGLVAIPGDRVNAPEPTTAAPVPARVATEPLAVTVQRTTYQPGQSSGWHAHPGLHAVVVLSGTLTVYDADCAGRTYGPTEPYVGGRLNHLARNDTTEPVEMMVVYTTAGPATDDYVVPQGAPEGCPGT